MIIDGTAASSYQILRRESSGGYAPLYDFALNPVQRFAQSGWKLFTWRDPRPSSFDPPTYLGRGIVSGVVTPTTPLTNVSVNHPGDLEEIGLTLVFVNPSDPKDHSKDSLRTIGYTPLKDAVGYFVQIYEGKDETDAAAIYNAAPSPFATQNHRDYYVAWLPATGGIIDPARVKVMSQIAFASQGMYAVRMSAVDARGRLVGYSYGDVWGSRGSEGYLRLYYGGSKIGVALSVLPGTVATPYPIRFEVAPASPPPLTALGHVRPVKVLVDAR